MGKVTMMPRATAQTRSVWRCLPSLAVVAVFVLSLHGGPDRERSSSSSCYSPRSRSRSTFVSFTLDPMLSSKWYDPEVEHGGHEATRQKTRNPIRRFAFAFDAAFERTADRYKNWLAWALRRRWWMIGGAAASIVTAFALFPLLGFTWVPDYDAGEFEVNFRVPPVSRIENTQTKGHEIATFLRSQPEVDFTYLSIGGGFRGGSNSGQIYVRLKPLDERAKSQAEIQTDLRVKLAQLPGVRPSIGGARSIFGGWDSRFAFSCRDRNRHGSRSPQSRCCRLFVPSPAWQNRSLATKGRFHSSTCASIGSKHGPRARHKQHSQHTAAALPRAARDALGRS